VKSAPFHINLFFIGLLLKATNTVCAKPSYPPVISDAREVTYKNASSLNLKLWILEPDGHKKGDKKPVIVFFFGGGWRGGTPAQFEMQCKYLASRGMVAITADYRVSSRHQTLATACVEDGKSAIRWIRENAGRLGIDTRRVAAGGGSAGGHVAAATGTIKGFEARNENIEISSKPNALVLFNPAVVLDDIGNEFVLPEEKKSSLPERVGTNPRKLSPYHHLDKTLPPTIIFHGTKDEAVPFETVRLFQRQADELGRHCWVVPFAGKPHGFFNWGRFENEPFRKSMKETDRFLSALGWIKGKPTIDQFITHKENPSDQ
jgi:acetyl esterase/lipase